MNNKMNWQVSPEDDEYIDDNDIERVLALKSAIESVENNDMIRDKHGKINIARMCFSIFVYLSFVSSIWLFIFDTSKWYGILIFGILSIAVWEIPKNGR